jgi:alcohol dehydrogenase class IV
MQQVIKGTGSLLQLASIINKKESRQVLWVIGKHLQTDANYIRLREKIPLPQQVVHPPNGVLPVDAIPKFSQLDTVIAIGGGKAIDFAKGILYQHPAPVTLMAAPTTAGSGSEATAIAVFYKGNEKVSLDVPALLPAVAVLDSLLISHLPAQQRAISGADALAQCVESVWNKHSNPIAENYSLTGFELLWQNLAQFVIDGSPELDEKMLWAAHLAGKAIAITRTTGPHALSYYLTANFGVPHGQAVALTLPLFFLYNDVEQVTGQLAKLYAVMKVRTAEEAFLECRSFFQRMGLAVTLPALGLNDLPLDDWLASVNQQRFANNPVGFSAVRLKELFRRYLS